MMNECTRLIADFDPIGGLTLRDARPFQAGDSFTASNLPFPPSPAPFWSAARKVLRQAGAQPSRLQASGFAVADTEGAYFPAPLDLSREAPVESIAAGNRDLQWTTLAPHREGAVIWSTTSDVPSAPLAGTFLNRGQWTSYLNGELIRQRFPDRLRTAADFAATDRRTGVRLRSDERKVQLGGLYTEDVMYLDRQRKARFRMAVDAEGSVPDRMEDIVRLGGEARITHVMIAKAREEDQWFDRDLRRRVRNRILAESAGGPLRVKLCLLTPAIFSGNVRLLQSKGNTPAWRPYWLADSSWDRKPFTAAYRLKLVAALTSKPSPLGFWDTSSEPKEWEKGSVEGGLGRPKPLYRCLPAGAVYFLELTADGVSAETALEQFFDLFWLGTILLRRGKEEPAPTYFGKMGFGWCVIGDWNYVG